jgi:Uncharacterized protein conserved in bacteria
MKHADELETILHSSKEVWALLEKSPSFGLDSYYIGAGVISQTVWNYQNKNPLLFGIEDVDFVYFDPDLSYEKEDRVIHQIQGAFAGISLKVDVKNEARVHLWYKSHFGYDIAPYHTLEEAIDSWPTTATAVGVRLEKGELKIYARFGLDDLFDQVIRPNKIAVKPEVYAAKCKKWTAKWPTLKVIPW